MAAPLLNARRNLPLTLIVIALFGLSLRADHQATETEIKAAYLYNFTKFIEWPSASPTMEPFRLCIVNDDRLKQAIDHTIEGESVNGRPLRSVVLRTVDETAACQVLFIGRSEPDRGAKFLAASTDLPVLTVADASLPASVRVDVEFVLEGHRLRFDINLTDAERRGLRISSKLLRVARQVRGCRNDRTTQRTPLNAMLGWTRLLRSRGVSTQDQDRALEKVERNAMMQARLVEDLLDVSRITTGKLKLDVRPVDLVAVANTAIDSIRPTAEARGVTIVRRFAEPSLPTGGDPDRLQQVIWNLLSNAVKFTPAGGTVTIGLRRAGDLDHLSVSDTGMGIEPAFLQSVFDTFRQADASATRAHGGLGLGLSIVRHLVELHAGTVIAESAGKSLGATFTVQLPVRTAAADAAIPGGVDLSHARLLAGLTVVVVDDDEDTRELLSSVLGSAGATVDAAANAADALVLCTHLRPDALISDIGMPGRDGYSLIRDVHAALGGSVPRLSVALSAYAAAHDRERAIAAGFDQHIAKPIDPDLLVQELHRLLTGRPAAAS